MKVIENITVGEPDTSPSKSSHTWGVREGNRRHTVIGDTGQSQAGVKGAGRPTAKVTSRRSTGINPEQRNPIDPDMPHLTPA
jgi:hypothetical protein